MSDFTLTVPEEMVQAAVAGLVNRQPILAAPPGANFWGMGIYPLSLL